jgi:hypothetical protein
MKKSNIKAITLLILLIDDIIHETTSLIVNMGIANIALAVITVI